MKMSKIVLVKTVKIEIDALLQNAESQIQSSTKMQKIDFLHSNVIFFMKFFLLNNKQSLAGCMFDHFIIL
jgi:hypothetical protein